VILMIEIGNGEKCPWCNVVNDPEKIDIIEHFLKEHPKEFEKSVFGGDDVGI